MSHGQGKLQNGQGKVREFCEGSWLDTLKLFCTLLEIGSAISIIVLACHLFLLQAVIVEFEIY